MYKLQAGVERYEGGKRVVRLTPADQKQDIPEPWGSLLEMAVKAADQSDMQPGDGELDFKIKDLPASVVSKVPQLALLKGLGVGTDGWNGFIRITRV